MGPRQDFRDWIFSQSRFIGRDDFIVLRVITSHLASFDVSVVDFCWMCISYDPYSQTFIIGSSYRSSLAVILLNISYLRTVFKSEFVTQCSEYLKFIIHNLHIV